VQAGADEAAARLHDAAAAEYLTRFDAQPVAQRLREQLIRRLPSGEPTRAALAAALHLTPRTLLRRLAAEGTNWKTLLNDVRRELALSYLRQNRSAAEITFLLGFADPANFTRAFRRWTGAPPRAWVSSVRDNRDRAGNS
jgi:AraC-like DNA-binding protein